MPDPGHLYQHGEAAPDSRSYIRQFYPGAGGLPGHPPLRGDLPPPSNAIAAYVMAAVQDPAARLSICLILEEAFRNFHSHSQKPPWMDPPWVSAGRGGGRIIDVVGHQTITANQNTWATPTDLVAGDVEAGYMAVLRWRGQGADLAEAWDYSYWRIVEREYQSAAVAGLATTYPIEPYIEWQYQLGQIETPDEIWAVVFGPKTWALQVRAFHIAAPDYELYGRIKGWKVPLAVNDPNLPPLMA